MVSLALPVMAATATADLARNTTIAVVALLTLVLSLGVGAFVILFRRRGDRHGRSTITQAALDAQAAALLVSLDDRARDAENEVGFAVAQFGLASAQEFDSALAEARLQLAEAFRLGQQRDTAADDAHQLRRRTTLQMIALCEKALASLNRFDRSFTERRRTELDAAQNTQELQARLGTLRDRVANAQQDHDDDARRYVDTVLAPSQQQLVNAAASLDHAEQKLDAASTDISPTGVNAVADRLHAAATDLHSAEQKLAASELALTRLGDADLAVGRLRDTSARDLDEARVALDRAPDPGTGAKIVTAMAAMKTALNSTAADPGSQRDPFQQLAVLTEASADLDAALTTARNQQQRFEHARAAYRGTLIAAQSQIAVVRELVGQGGASASVRTRLAEAERQLMIAEAETDPVEALDAIRRSVTHARDADALARY